MGPGQGELHANNPHELTDVLLTQVPLQSCVPSGQTHRPAVQFCPPRQLLPHEPQLAGSERVSTQALLHIV